MDVFVLFLLVLPSEVIQCISVHAQGHLPLMLSDKVIWMAAYKGLMKHKKTKQRGQLPFLRHTVICQRVTNLLQAWHNNFTLESQTHAFLQTFVYAVTDSKWSCQTKSVGSSILSRGNGIQGHLSKSQCLSI